MRDKGNQFSAQAPGTVSRILWHFTGGPTWDMAKDRQDKRRKSDEAAYEALVSILKSKELRIGHYKEVVKVKLPTLEKFDPSKKKRVHRSNVWVTLASAPVCCLADIPIAHLSYHASRYGKFAIGFHRDSAVKANFNPVFYTLHDTHVLQSVYEGFAQLQEVNLSGLVSVAEDVTIECEHGHEVDVSDIASGLASETSYVDDVLSQAKNSFERFLAFVKTFDREEFSTIYCEREWRSVETFSFTFEDVAMVVLPKGSDGTKSFFKRFTNNSSHLKFPRAIPVVPWEDLIEH